MRFFIPILILISTSLLSCSEAVDNTIEGTTTPALNVSESSYVIAVGNSVTITPKGGRAPYAYTIRSGTGTIDTNGKFTATAAGTVIIAITDGKNQEEQVTIEVKSALASSVSQAVSYIGYTISITDLITGGVPPYDYTIQSGAGQITSTGLYTGSTGTDVIKVNDNRQNSVSFQVKNYTKPLIDIDFTRTFVVNPLFTMVGGSTRGAFFNSSGVLESPSTANQLRIGHDPITKKPLGMLIEQARTQVLLRSEVFEHTLWDKTGTTVSPNQLTAPDGSTGVDILYETAGTSEHKIRQDNLTMTANIGYTWSVYVKKLNKRWIALSAYHTSLLGRAWFDLDNGVWGTVDAGIFRAHTPEHVGNGIYRIAITALVTASPGSFELNLAESDGGGLTYAGDATKGVYIWGAQVNGDSTNWMGVSPTYKVTAGATVTSTDDRVDMPDFQKWFNYEEGTFLTNVISTQKARLIPTVFNMGDATYTPGNFFTIYRGHDYQGYKPTFKLENANVETINFVNTPGWEANSAHSLGLNYQTSSGAAFYDNGTEIGTSASAFTMPPFTRARLGQLTPQNNFVALSGYFNRFTYWPTKLSNTTLQELSSATTFLPTLTLARTSFNRALNGSTVDLSAYVAGGTAPYIYTHSGAGSTSSAGVFTPSSAGSATVTVTDTKGNAAKFDITVIAPTVEFDFTQGSLSSLDGNYAVTFTRASTATYFDATGVMKTAAINTPRFDYDPKTLTPLGLLIEMNKTNMITQSQVDQWTAEQLTMTANQGVSPDGTMSADKIKATANFPRVRIGFTPVASTKYVLSVYAKMLVGTNITLRYEQTGDVYRVSFNGTTGAMVSTTAGTGTSTTYGSKDIGNGWFRFWISSTAPVTIGNFWIIPGLYNGITPTEEILVWGAQVEEGVTPSSYIPTAGATAARSWDQAIETTVGWVTQGKGTFHVTASQPYDVVGNTDQYSIANLYINGNNAITAFKADNTTPSVNTNKTRVRIRTGGTDQILISVGSFWTANSVRSAAIAYAKNYVRGSVTGGTTDDFDAETAGANSTVTALTIGYGGNTGGGTSSRIFDGHIRTFKYWPFRMTNEDLAVLAPP